MERNSLSNNFKQHSIGERSMKDNNNNNRVKDSWEYCSSESHGGDLLSGFSWPPRSYTCSFCKREFRSAQALGGHMNVHRRDRARLRQSPPRDGQYPFLNLNLYPNPNNPSSSLSSSPSTRFPPFTSTLPPLASSSLSSLSSPSSVSPSEIAKWGVDITKIKSPKVLFVTGEFEGFTQENECEVFKKADIVRLDLEIGLLSDSKEDLDLELHLGCS